MGSITKEDLKDVDFIDAAELAATGGAPSVYKSGVAVTSTTAGTKRIVVSGFDFLLERDTPVQAGDKVVLAGTTGGADGTYTVNAIINATTIDVVEAIATSTGGTAEFRHPPGSSKIGVDTTGFTNTSATLLQDVLEDIDAAAGGSGSVGTNTDFLLENPPPTPTNNYIATRTGGVVTLEEWERDADDTLIKSIDYTRSGGVVTQEVIKVFDTDGTTILGQLTIVYTRTGGVVTSATVTRDI